MTPPATRNATRKAKVLRLEPDLIDGIEEVRKWNDRSAEAEIRVAIRKHLTSERRRRRRARAAVK